MNRREFFKMASAFVAAAMIPVGRLFHRLMGDGKTDDTAAMQALLDGETVIGPDGRWLYPQFDGETIRLDLPAGEYRMTSTLVVGEQD